MRKTITDIFWLFLVSLLIFLPFAVKAFHIDDPLFIYASRQILQDPLHFYAFSLNWYGYEMPMVEVMKNPPAFSYYLALVSYWSGENELTFHLSLIVPWMILFSAVYFLAKRMCARPLLATLIGMIVPATFVSSSNVMCDIPMTALFMSALVFWIYAQETNIQIWYFVSVVLASFCLLTKYFGVVLIPLLCVYDIYAAKRVRWCLFWLVIPVAVAWGFNEATRFLYGQGLLSSAIFYTRETSPGWQSKVRQFLVAIVFLGGGIGPVAGVFWWGLRKTGKMMLLVSCGLMPLILYFVLRFEGDIAIQAGLYLVSGTMWVFILILLFMNGWRKQDGLLFLLGAGTVVFTGVFNWTTSIRNLIPIAVLSGVILVRFLEQRCGNLFPQRAMWVGVILSALVSFGVARSDYLWANHSRMVAKQIQQRYSHRTIWFQGHWGFQYYMEQNGWRPLDVYASPLRKGDLVVNPSHNTNVFPLNQCFRKIDVITLESSILFGTMHAIKDAGFYASVFGILPYSVLPKATQRFEIYQLVK